MQDSELREKIEELRKSKSEDDRKLCIPLLKDYLSRHADHVESWYDLAGAKARDGHELARISYCTKKGH